MKRQRTVVFWAFNIDIIGPYYDQLSQHRNARRALAKKLKQIEKAALLAAKEKPPRGFTAVLS